MLQQLDRRGCTLIDTTCGSVLNVWKNVRRYAEGGYTSIIHGKVWHEETQATASQAVEHGGRVPGRVRPRRNRVRLRLHPQRRRPRRVPGALRQRGLAGLRSRPRSAAHRPREPDDDADVRVARDRRDDAARRWSTATGSTALADHFQAFDTICSATQDRQDAVVNLLREKPVDLMIVIGGYNSSNTATWRASAPRRGPTFHIADPDCLVSADEIRHRPVGVEEVTAPAGWLPRRTGHVGLTSGASTPDNLVGAAIAGSTEFCAGPAVHVKVLSPSLN